MDKLKKVFKVLAIIFACIFCLVIIAGAVGNFYFGDLNVPEWIEKIKNSGKKPEEHTHTYTETVVLPNCTEQGYTLYSCECGESYKSDYTEILSHSYTKTVVQPTCAEQGYTLYTCSVCGESYKSNYTEPLSHPFMKTTVVRPTCAEQGYTLHTCILCGESYQSDYTEPTGNHDYVCRSHGESYDPLRYWDNTHFFVCSVCGKFLSSLEPLEPLEPSFPGLNS